MTKGMSAQQKFWLTKACIELFSADWLSQFASTHFTQLKVDHTL